jgi:pimeloyl-ACP methyl ester carboxylesterase
VNLEAVVMRSDGMAAAQDEGDPLGGRSEWLDFDGPVHYLDFGGPPGGPLIICVHGLGGCAVNWSAIAPLLTGRYRLLAPDLSGHGLTWSARRGSGVPANRVLLDRFLAAVAAGPAVLMGNSMGGMISLLEAAAVPHAVAGLILIDPALPFALARPDPLVATLFAAAAIPGAAGLVGRRRVLSAEATVAAALSLCCADPAAIPREVVARHVEVVRQRTQIAGADRDFINATRSVAATVVRGRGRVLRHAIGRIGCPVLLIHGERDRLVPVAVARAAARAHPSWSFAVLPGIGHVPMLEAPDETARLVSEWLDSAGGNAADSTRGS